MMNGNYAKKAPGPVSAMLANRGSTQQRMPASAPYGQQYGMGAMTSPNRQQYGMGAMPMGQMPQQAPQQPMQGAQSPVMQAVMRMLQQRMQGQPGAPAYDQGQDLRGMLMQLLGNQR